MVELNIDKSNWQLISFGDVAIQKKGRVDRESTTLTRYVKGEHMGSEDIHLREWGELDDEYLGPAFHRRFDEGDILYGSRRTYLKKVCIAPFAGITSNTTFVVEANEEFLDKRLLPFIMLSEGFTKHSIQHSKGSVNPYINWKDLANYEFLLPPKDQQAEIAELLVSHDAYLESALDILGSLRTLQRAVNSKTFEIQNNDQGVDGSPSLKWVTLEALSTSPICYGIVQPGGSVQGGVPLVQIKNMIEFEDSRMHFVDAAIESSFRRSRITENDLIIAIKGTIGRVAIVPRSFEGNIGRDIAKVELPDSLVRSYVFFCLKSEPFQRLFNRLTVGSTRPEVSIASLRKISIPILPRQRMEEICQRLENIESLMSSSRQVLESGHATKMSLTNSLF